MTLLYIIRALQQIALQQKNIRTATDGSIYEFLDNNPSVQYNVFHITQTTHRTEDDFDYYGFNLFFVGRLEDNMENNRLDLQSEGKEVITNILRVFCEHFDIEMPTLVFTPFTQKFSDLTAGVYCNLEIEVPVDWLCEDDGGIALEDIFSDGGSFPVQIKSVRITSNGTVSVAPDSGYAGLSRVDIITEVPAGYTEDDLDAAYNDGVNYQKSKLATLTARTNTTYTRADGYSAITVNVPSTGYTEQDLQNAYNSGATDQKAKLTAITATTNGTYERTDGYSKVVVNVDTGETFQTQTLEVLENGTYVPDSGYDGFSSVVVNVPINNTAKEMRYKTRSGNILPTSAINASYGFDFETLNPTSNTYTNGIGVLEYKYDIAWLYGIQNNQDLKSVDIPDYVRSINENAFSGCTYMTSVAIPNTVWTVKNGAFKGCNSLTSIKFPGSVVAIESNVCSGCSALNTLTFGTHNDGIGVELGGNYLGSYAFADCRNLRMIFCYNKYPIALYDDGTSHYSSGEGPVFTNLPANGQIHVRTDATDYSSWMQYFPSGWTISYDLVV